MKLTAEQLNRYEEEGLVFLPELFSAAEVDALRDETASIATVDHPSRVMEKDGKTVRALHGSHLTSPLMARLTRSPRLLEPSRQLVGGPAYVHQFKINFKAAFGGDVWKWHQDYIFWRKGDGMPEARCVNLMIFLDEVTEFNGPLMLIPGSHRHGMIDVDSARGAGGWQDNVAADLKYTLDRNTIARLVTNGGMVAPKGPRGSALIFHPNLAHASTPNLSPWDRTMLIVTYNSVENVPVPPGEPRPEFLVSRDARPLEAVEEILVA
ncbi:MAG TPA: phytanoyl-CoA dioxygenase family protein [Opitutaceae bacterium]|jgi:ectoine hydroxylase